MLQAGTEAGLEEPFVQVISLGDFSVTYRIAGLLTDVKSMISARSKLHKAVLDCLHNANIEIVSPTFVNSRPQPDDRVMIPVRQRIVQVNEPDAPRPEDILFDKAEEAEAIQRDKMTVEAELAAIQEQLSGADSEQKDALKIRRDELKAQLAELATPVKEEAEQSESGPGIIKSPYAE